MAEGLTVSRRTRMARVMMEKPLEERTKDELLEIAKELKVPVEKGATKEVLVETLTNASRAPTASRAVSRETAEDPPKDVKNRVLHERRKGAVQEGGTGSEGARKARAPKSTPSTSSEE